VVVLERYEFMVSAPGRITIFGEHQDYLGLPIIPAAINRRIYVKGTKIDRTELQIYLWDIGVKIFLPLNKILPYEKPREYIKSVLNVFYKHGYKLDTGYKIEIYGMIPIASGLSSSSALVTAFMKFLLETTGESFSAMDLAMMAYEAEVLEFKEPGGFQDHIASSFGGVVYIEPQLQLPPKVTRLPEIEGYFVIGNSGVQKPTLQILSRIKNDVNLAVREIRKHISFNTLMELSISDIESISKEKEIPKIDQLTAALEIRDITLRMKELIKSKKYTPEDIGENLNTHQQILRDKLKVSTPELDKMIEISLKNGALGAKIVGAGGGGCIMAYTIKDPEAIELALKDSGFDAFTVSIDEGARVEKHIIDDNDNNELSSVT